MQVLSYIPLTHDLSPALLSLDLTLNKYKELSHAIDVKIDQNLSDTTPIKPSELKAQTSSNRGELSQIPDPRYCEQMKSLLF